MSAIVPTTNPRREVTRWSSAGYRWCAAVGAIALVLMSTTGLAAEPDDSPTMAPDLPGVSVRLRPGEVAPFDGRQVELEENRRRGAAIADCRGELASAKENAWMSKGAVVALIVGSVVLGAAAGAGVTAWAMRR